MSSMWPGFQYQINLIRSISVDRRDAISPFQGNMAYDLLDKQPGPQQASVANGPEGTISQVLQSHRPPSGGGVLWLRQMKKRRPLKSTAILSRQNRETPEY
ncbi:MAG: hypothetical protein K9I85_14115 [Saprospiraceae bacterium]|nr:hypothetical protein [Saprospiraceae bacterium]